MNPSEVKPKIQRVLLCAGAALAWVALVVFQVDVSGGFGAGALLGLLLVTSLLGFLISLFVSAISRNWRMTRQLGAVLLIVLTSSGVARLISARQRQASIAEAQPIIVAAERFYADSGAYPQSIDGLIPAYLPSAPRTKMGFRGGSFGFSGRPDGFRISFALPTWMLCSYDSRSKQWHISD